MPGRRTNTEDCFWLLGSLCNLYRIPFDAALVASQFPPPYTLATFHEAARALGFKTGVRPLPSDGWAKYPFPCIAFLKPQAQNEASRIEALPGDHQVIPFPAHPEKPPPSQTEPDEASEPVPEILTPILIVKTDGQHLLYFRTGSQAPETLNLADAPKLLEPDLILIAREQAGADGKPEDIAGFG